MLANDRIAVMIVHFVCSGNSFRSRLAEAYLKSLDIPGIEVMSSGANTQLDSYRFITPYAALLLKKYGLEKYASKDKIQLTQARLDAGDITVCVNRDVYHECLEHGLKMPLRTYVWDIQDVEILSRADQIMLDNHEILPLTEEIFQKIEKHVDELVAFLKRPKLDEPIDVLDKFGDPTGSVSDVDTVHEQGLIHGGVHVGLYTKNGKVVMERRSSNIIFNPGLWDISMGGMIRSGEQPEKTLLREVKEELGIKLRKSRLQKLFVWNYDHYMPSYGLHDHSFTHTYIAEIPEIEKFIIQKAEVAEAKLLNIDEAELMNENNKKSVGAIIPTHAYNKRILDAVRVAIA